MDWSHSVSLRRSMVLPLLGVLMLVMPLLPTIGNGAASAAQSSTLPESVLQSSVRLQMVIEATPTGRRAEPVLCEYPQGGILEFGNGSGTLISSEGFILTNHHVTEAIDMDIPEEIVEFCAEQAGDEDSDVSLILLAWTPNERGVPSEAYRIEIIEESARADDMAIVQITEGVDGSRVNTRRNPFPYVQFGDSDLLREPETITMIGYPGNAGVNRRVSEGIFSGWGDNGSGVDWIYTDAVGSGGISGGTAVNTEGLFIGIPSAGTSDDCRPGDTNKDGLVDEADGCIGTGGNYTILIPGNLAREFAEDATGLELDVAEQATPGETPEPTATDEPVDPSAPLIENIEFTGMDDEGNVISDMTDLRRLEACFDSAIPGGSILEVTWLLDGETYFVTELEWQDAYNPSGCVSIFLTDEAVIPFLDPGVYSTQIVVNGETFTSGEVEVFRSESTSGNNVESISLRGRTTESQSVSARRSVLTGQFTSLTATISFVDMEPGMAWQADLTFGDEVVTSTNPEVWTGEEAGSESVRLLPPGDVFEPGEYGLTVTINGEVVFTEEFAIEE